MKHKNLPYIILAALVLLMVVLGAYVWLRPQDPEQQIQKAQTRCEQFAASLKGQTEASATEKLTQNNKIYRIAVRDNEQAGLTSDFSPERINLSIEKGIITSADCY